jgi:rhodanese-related sulfurtransferase
MFLKKNHINVNDFLACREESLLIDIRGTEDFEPAIPGSKSIYILKILERVPEFEEQYGTILTNRPVLLYCSNEGGSKMLQKKFSKQYDVKYLKDGMISYLETITKLLAEHPYEKPELREETIRKLLEALTNRNTPFPIFKKITANLLQINPTLKVH